MWLYLGISVITAVSGWYFSKTPLAKDLSITTKEVCKAINQHGLSICVRWTNQLIANKLGERLVEMHHHHYIVSYPYGVTWYKIIIPRRRGPCLVDTIVDGDDNDVKKELLPFMGPSHNFHGAEVTPKMLGYERLTFSYLNGDMFTFFGDEAIQV